MRRQPAVVLAAMAIAAATVVGAYAGSPYVKRDKPATRDAVVMVSAGGGHGSGVNIGSGYIITAAHVVGDSNYVSIKRTDGRIGAARVLWRNSSADLAALTTTLDMPAAQLDCAVLPVGAELESAGNPINEEFVSSFGRIAGEPRKVGNVASVYVTSITTVMGMSGGPLFHDGRVAAINSMVMLAPLPSGDGYIPTMTGFGYAVPSAEICKLMGRAK